MKNTPFVVICFALFLLSTPAISQFADNFDQGSLEGNGWSGDLENFIMNGDEQLQLFDADPESSNQSILGQSLTTGDSTTWEFWCRLDFAPSAANYAEVILALDVPELNSGNGYVLRIGGISGDQDALGLYRKTGNDYQLLAEGTPGAVGGSEVLAGIRITRNADFIWEIWADYTGGTNYTLEGEVMDDTYPIGNYFAFSCIYSSSRADKFFFDNLLIGPEFIDQVPPLLIDRQMDGNGDILLTFSESLDAATANDISNYQFSPNLNFNNPEIVNGAPNQINIDITSALVSGEIYSLTLSGIEDLFSNSLMDTTVNFEFLEISVAEPFDILITEIMADPNPSVGLPEYEYMELWNRSDKYFRLSDLIFEDGGGEIDLPNVIMEPGEYLALTNSNSVELLDFPNTVAVNFFPSLTNDGEKLTIKRSSGEIIHTVNYNISWYQDSDRDDGGFSLEMISANRLCEGRENWRASMADIGGTPGLINANNDDASSSGAPEITNAIAVSSQEIQVHFSQSISDDYVDKLDNFQLDGFNVVASASANNGLLVALILDEELLPNQVVELRLASPLVNCLGDPFNTDQSWLVGLPTNVEVGDLLINELLFNPRSGESDYVELYNQSDKILDLGELFFASRDEDGNLESIKSIFGFSYLFPKSYIAFTENTEQVAVSYPDPDRPGIIVFTDLPSMADKEGTLLIYRDAFPEIEILDEFSYEDDFHNPLLSDLNGVSLERLSFDRPTNQASNWGSAAGFADFGTPAAPNSRFREAVIENGADFIAGDMRLSPDDDGFEDILLLQYQDDSAEDFAVSLRIYNSAGQLIKVLANNQTVGAEAFFKWEGDMNTGEKAPIGLYILWAERFSPGGIVERLKKSIVVATYLD